MDVLELKRVNNGEYLYEVVVTLNPFEFEIINLICMYRDRFGNSLVDIGKELEKK